MDDIQIVKYQKSDYPKFRDFVRAAFHPKYILSDEKFLDWQYLSPNAALMLAKVGDKIVGFFGYKDFTYKVYSETKIVRAIMNLFVAEKYRMAGVGPKLAEAVFNTSNNILVSSYNEPSWKLYRHYRANLKEAGNLNRYMAVLGRHRLLEGLEIPHLNPALNALSGGINPPPSAEGGGRGEGVFSLSKVEEEAGDEFDEFWKEARGRYPVTIERSAEYLNWRFINHPFFDYQFLAARKDGKLAGFLVYRFEESGDFKIARIIDFVSTPEAEKELLADFLARAGQDGAVVTDFMFSGSIYKESLIKSGFFDIRGTDFERFPIRFNPISDKKLYINIAYDVGAPLTDAYLTKADSDQDRPNPH